MTQEWSHVGVRLDGSLRSRLEDLAGAEAGSLSDLVRRAVQIYISGGPEPWERQQQRTIERRARSSQQTILSPEVRICGEWLAGLPESARNFVMQAGRAVGSVESVQRASTRWYEFLKLSPFLIWYAEAQPPIPIDLPEHDQLRRIIRDVRLVECNDTFARISGYRSGNELANLRLVDVYSAHDDGIRQVITEFLRSGYEISNWLLTTEPRRGARRRSIAHLVGRVEGGFLLGLWGIAQQLDAFDGELKRKPAVDEGDPK